MNDAMTSGAQVTKSHAPYSAAESGIATVAARALKNARTTPPHPQITTNRLRDMCPRERIDDAPSGLAARTIRRTTLPVGAHLQWVLIRTLAGVSLDN